MTRSMIEAGSNFTVEAISTPTFREAERYCPLLRQPNDAIVALRRAQQSLGRACSWRNFLVSGCAITLMDPAETVSLIHGVNNKPERNGSIDVHAEDMVIEQLAVLARRPVSVLALVGDVQPDDTTNLSAGAILPCASRCLPQLQTAELMRPETLLVSGTKDLTTVLCYNLDALQAAYEENDPLYLGRVELDTPFLRDPDEVQEKLVIPLGKIASSYPPEVQVSYRIVDL